MSEPHTRLGPVLGPEVRQLLDDLGAMPELALGDVERPFVHDQVLALWDRCRGVFEAVRVLLDHELVHEAAILTRPLFEDSLVLMELAAAKDKRRLQIVIARQLDALARLERIFRRMESRGEDVTRNASFLAGQNSALRTYAHRQEVDPKGWTQDLEKIAKRTGRYGKEYDGYLLTHQFVHGSAAITDQRVKVKDGVMVIGGEAVDTASWETPVAVSACYSMALAYRATCGILDVPEPDGLDAAITRIEEISEPDGSGSGGMHVPA